MRNAARTPIGSTWLVAIDMELNQMLYPPPLAIKIPKLLLARVKLPAAFTAQIKLLLTRILAVLEADCSHIPYAPAALVVWVISLILFSLITTLVTKL